MKNNRNTLAALFDMDGVIVHTNPYHKKAFKIFLDKHDISISDQELKDHVYGRTNAEIFPYIFKDKYTPEKGEEWANEKEAIFRDLYKKDVEPVPGLIGFLDELQRREIKAAVGTSAPIENLNFIMDSLDLRHYFDAFLHSADVSEGKPNPEIYLKAADRLEIDPKFCVVFEDSVAGVKAGLNAGMIVVGVATTHTPDEFNGAHLVIEDFEGLTMEQLFSLFQ
ncbi:HAD family hydrolase [Rhodohalobacter sulfatireducens]|uniref:HAD family phosphatase n=1 Tax=Rhodohalobacter sulfatireducens TaxID=2911366 RepID=A0ABS9K8T2_9BACT|nr:HAD family phosphatase [Rhodohalobacter sulfatireducens]MCG2587260.1 HAD family phosphatase [Rhodohalobacter sulfatireducens]